MIANFRVIRTYLPLTVEPTPGCLASIETLRAVCPDFRTIFNLVQARDPIGRVGKYAGVYGVALAAGGDVPLNGSHPLRVSKEEGGATAVLSFTTYAAQEVPLTVIHAFVEEVAKLHSWEHPVIEINDAQLWMPIINDCGSL